MSVSDEDKRLPILSLPPSLLLMAAMLALALGASFGDTSAAAAGTTVHRITLPIHHNAVDQVHWSDTFGAPRSGGRSHIGVDMLGPKMVPLVAARSGVITWGRFNNDRGSILRIRDDEGWEYQYIHLNNDTPGTDNGNASCSQVFSARLCSVIDHDGDFVTELRVTEGEIIAYLGDGGNAEWTASHLHFEVYKPAGNGTEPTNPTPVVDAARARILNGSAGNSPPPSVEPGADGFADHLWYQLHGRYPSISERAAFQSRSVSDGLWAAIAGELDEQSTASMVDRLYLAFFLRYPDTDGIQYWIRIRAAGHDLEDIAEWFADSDEYRTRYDGTPFDDFLDQLYLDVLGRSPDEEGKAYWLDRLEDEEVSRGTIVVYFTESAEMRTLSVNRNELVALSLIKNGSVPTATEVAAWQALRGSSSTADALAQWYGS